MSKVNRKGPVIVLALAAMGLTAAGCGGVSDSLGLGKRPPDEFTVVKKNPLVVPPDFTLRPPASGVNEPRPVNPQEMAYSALFPEGGNLPEKSGGEIALLRESGAENANPDVRSALLEDDQTPVPKGSFTREILQARELNGGPTIRRIAATPAGGK